MHTRTILSAATFGLILATAACGGSSTDATTTGGQGGGKLAITSPADGATVSAPFALTWHSPVPLGPTDSGKDHVHVYVDGHENDYTVVGGTRFQVKDLSPGRHEVGIALQHADHSPVGPEDSIHVTVSGSGGSSPTDDMTGSTTDDNGGGGGYGY
jgi:hypothetical protein